VSWGTWMECPWSQTRRSCALRPETGSARGTARQAAATPSLPFVWSPPIEEAAQVNVTRVTVNDRQAPPEPAPYGTQMARRLAAPPARISAHCSNRESASGPTAGGAGFLGRLAPPEDGYDAGVKKPVAVQLVPVGARAGQARHLDAQHQPHMPMVISVTSRLNPTPVGRAGPGLAKVLVDHQHPRGRPAQPDRPLHQPVLQPGRLAMVSDLLAGGLAHIHHRQPLKMPIWYRIRAPLPGRFARPPGQRQDVGPLACRARRLGCPVRPV
jgi:hypothetical protein